MTPWSIRGLFFVLGAALLFASTIRPLGLIFAGPIAMAIFTVALTALCIGLFSSLLQLPIPVLPSSLPYPFNEIF